MDDPLQPCAQNLLQYDEIQKMVFSESVLAFTVEKSIRQILLQIENNSVNIILSSSTFSNVNYLYVKIIKHNHTEILLKNLTERLPVLEIKSLQKVHHHSEKFVHITA